MPTSTIQTRKTPTSTMAANNTGTNWINRKVQNAVAGVGSAAGGAVTGVGSGVNAVGRGIGDR